MWQIISILISVLAMVNSKCNIDGNIDQLESALRESADYMSEHAKNEDVCICIGGTRAGKSTLVNYLIGTELKAVNFNRFNPNVLEKVNEKSSGPDIGHGIVSKTTIPTRWVSKIHENLILWDVAGFSDNRGPIQDITNAFYMYQLMRQVKSLKILLVIDVNDILQDNTDKFFQVLKALENLFGEALKNYYSSIAVIFSKGKKTFEDSPLDAEFITEKLEYQFLSDNSMDISNVIKGFIEYLTKHPKQIGQFRKAGANGIITSDIDVNISQAISSCQSIPNENLLQLQPSISENSRLCLHELQQKFSLTPSLDLLENDMRNILQNIASKKNSYNQKRKLLKLKTLLTAWKSGGALNTCSLQNQIIRNTYSEIRKIVGPTRLLDKRNLIEFVNKLLGYDNLNICYHIAQE